MPFERTERNISTLISQVSAGEIRLPEIQRRYVWKQTQVAKLVESLYRGYPTGYLLFWKTDVAPRTLSFDTGTAAGQSVVQPLYLLDGQQRLTALHRVFNEHPDAQVVFNVQTEEFKNQTNATAADPRWVKVCDVTRSEPRLYGMVKEIYPAVRGLGATDTKLGQDIPAARSEDPVRSLLGNLGMVGGRIAVTPRDLAGRGLNSPYFLLSFLSCLANGAHDWWYGTTIAPGGDSGQQLEHHHIHPRATLSGYAAGEVNDLANLAFISARANKKISDRSPAEYFPDLGEDELAAHRIPLDTSLRTASAYRDFLAARRQLLATAMTALLDRLRPSWLASEPVREADPLAGCELHAVCYESVWDVAKMAVMATRDGARWSAILSVPDLKSSLNDVREGLASDVEIGGASVPVRLDGEDVRIQFGPFEVTGTLAEWEVFLGRTRSSAQPLSQCPSVATEFWEGELIQFPVTNID